MNSSVFYDALGSPHTSYPLENECDTLYALLFNNRVDSPAGACPEALSLDDPSMHAMSAPTTEDPTMHCLSDDGGQLVLTPCLEPSLHTAWRDSLDQTSLQWPSSADSESPLASLDSLNFLVGSSYAQENEYAVMMSPPPLCLDPTVLLSPATQGLLHSLQNTSFSEGSQATPLCTPVSSPLIEQPTATSSSSGYSSRSDLDVGFYSDGDASDDEYIPSSSGRSGKKRYSPHERKAPRRVPRDVLSVSPPSSPTPLGSSRTLRTCRRARPRNVQADVPPSLFEDALTNGACMCPAPGCDYIPATRRIPDLRRHMRTHRARESREMWVCCGVPLEDARAYGITDTSESYDYMGFEMVGGCLRGFSRKDALIRHLRNEHLPCRGDADLAERLSQG